MQTRHCATFAGRDAIMPPVHAIFVVCQRKDARLKGDVNAPAFVVGAAVGTPMPRLSRVIAGKKTSLK